MLGKYEFDEGKEGIEDSYKKLHNIFSSMIFEVKRLLTCLTSSDQKNLTKIKENFENFLKEIEKEIKELAEIFPEKAHDIKSLFAIVYTFLQLVEMGEEDLWEVIEDLERFILLFDSKEKVSVDEIYFLAFNIARLQSLALNFYLHIDNYTYYVELSKEGKVKNSKGFEIKLNKKTTRDLVKNYWEEVKVCMWHEITIHNNLEIDFGFFIWSLILNTFKNSKEAKAEKILLKINIENEEITIEISDDWTGMDDETLTTKLFKKWKSSKNNGWWIWMYKLVKTILKEGYKLVLDTECATSSLQAWYDESSISESNILPNFVINKDKWGKTWTTFKFLKSK